MNRIAAACAALLALLPGSGAAQGTNAAPGAGAAMPAAENTGPNSTILRRVQGVYRYETLKDGRRRGEERFTLLVHPDGSRTLNVWHDLAARNAQFTVLLRVAADFRPLEAYVSYWNGGRYKGSGFFLVDGTRLVATSRGPAGLAPQELEVPARFSLGTHPVAGDGWHAAASYDAARGGRQALTFYSLEASTDVSKPVLGTLRPLEIERIGEEEVEVPAGRFRAMRWRLSGVNDLWVVGEDQIVVKSVIAARDLQYVLTELQRSP